MSETEDETMTDNTESASQPFTPFVQGRIPAKPLPVTIPVRKPTAPTLVTGKSNKNTREHSDSSETGEPSTKKRNTNGRTKKHKNK